MKQISVNSLPCVSRRKREGKNLLTDFKRTLKGVLEDSEIFKAKRAPAETEHGHTDLHTQHPRSQPQRGRGTPGTGSQEVSDRQHCILPTNRHYFLTPSPAQTLADSLLLRAHTKSQPVTESSPTPAAFNAISRTPAGLERAGKHREARPYPPPRVWRLPAPSLLCHAGMELEIRRERL